MSIARAFTTRRVKQSLQPGDGDSAVPHRSNTTKGSIGSIRHKKISAPIELIHTTNMLSYNAPDIYPKKKASLPSITTLSLTTSSPTTPSSSRSDDDISDSATTNASTPPTSPDVPAQRSVSPEPNHLSCYFTAPSLCLSPLPLTSKPESPVIEKPVIPQRALSHTKKASYEGLKRHRSTSRLSEQSSRTVSTKASFTFSRSSSSSTSTSATSHTSISVPTHQAHHIPKISSSSITPPSPSANTATPPPVQYQHRKEYSESHPFGQELAQVREIAEEYGIKEQLNVIDEEEQELVARGLFKFSAEEYVCEIRKLSLNFFAERPSMRQPAALWI